MKWLVEFNKFHIEYQPRKAIKDQALVDFIVERLVAKRMMMQEIIAAITTRKVENVNLETTLV